MSFLVMEFLGGVETVFPRLEEPTVETYIDRGIVEETLRPHGHLSQDPVA